MKKIALCFYILLITHVIYLTNAFSRAQPDTFKKYKNHYFIETGTFKGEGIQLALDTKFSQIFSIEIHKGFFQNAKKKFQGYNNVHIIKGDSGKILGEIIQNIDEPITFWLDAHWKGYAAILQELQHIKNHHIKNHTILIDDIMLFRQKRFGDITPQDILNKILEINPNYSISYEDGCEPNDILVASIPTENLP